MRKEDLGEDLWTESLEPVSLHTHTHTDKHKKGDEEDLPSSLLIQQCVQRHDFGQSSVIWTERKFNGQAPHNKSRGETLFDDWASVVI